MIYYIYYIYILYPHIIFIASSGGALKNVGIFTTHLNNETVELAANVITTYVFFWRFDLLIIR